MVAHLDGGDFSKQRPPCKISATITISLQIRGLQQATGTHPIDLLEVNACASPQYLDRNLAIQILAFPYVSVPARTQWVIQLVVGWLNFDGSWEQTQTTTYLAQNTQAFLLEPWQ